MFVIIAYCFFRRRIIMAVNSSTLALNGIEPIMSVIDAMAPFPDSGVSLYGVLVNAFELRYALYRGFLLRFPFLVTTFCDNVS